MYIAPLDAAKLLLLVTRDATGRKGTSHEKGKITCEAEIEEAWIRFESIFRPVGCLVQARCPADDDDVDDDGRCHFCEMAGGTGASGGGSLGKKW